jgi:putative SOS response-associated peptidase YedK
MCVFVSISREIEELEKRFKAEADRNFNYKPVFHATAFTHPALPVITQARSSVIDFYEWGLVPFWVKDGDTAGKLRINTVNAKAESLTERPTFRHTLRDRRCLVIADGFYEFQEVNGKKYPWYIRLKEHEIFAFAGLTDCWTDRSTGEVKNSFTIITTEANPLLAKIHNRKKRMPVILSAEDELEWISNTEYSDKLSRLLNPFDEKKMEAWTVSRLLTARGVEHNVPEVIEYFQYPELKEIQIPLPGQVRTKEG